MKIELSMLICDDHRMQYTFNNSVKTYSYIETGDRTVNFLNDFLNCIYNYLVSYHKKEIQHNDFYSATIHTEDDGIIDVEFKFTEQSTIEFRIWRRSHFSTPNTQSELIIKTELCLIDFLNFVLEGYSIFLKSYGFTQISDRVGEKDFPLVSYLKLLRYFKSDHSDEFDDLQHLEQNIPYSTEISLLQNEN